MRIERRAERVEQIHAQCVALGGSVDRQREDAIASFGAEPPTVVKKVRVAQKTGEVFE